MADQVQDSLLREIDEELRQEQYAKLWKKYGNYVIAAALALVVGVAGFQGWRTYDVNTRLADGERFAAAQQLVRAGKPDAARQAFGELAADASSGYALLARLQEAALMAETGDRAGAETAYAEVAGDGGVDATFRDLARVSQALLAMDGANPDEVRERLAPLTADDNPWRHTALELSALVLYQAGKTDDARQAFKRLSEDSSAPSGVRARAREILAALGK